MNNDKDGKSAPNKERMKVRSNFLRQLQSQAIYDDQDCAYEDDEAALGSRSAAVSVRKELRSGGFGGHSKGSKPARFNEELDTQSRHSLPVSEYLNQSHGRNSKKLKVNLRSINNPAERDLVRKMHENRSNILMMRPVTSQDQ